MNFELERSEQEELEPMAESVELKPPVISLDKLEKICEGDEKLETLLGNMLKSCVRYTITVARWERAHIESQGEATEEMEVADGTRTSVHDVAIADINALSRALGKAGKDNTWMSEGGMTTVNIRTRPAYTRFAISLSLSRIK